jgi:hypothetical protein
MNLEGKSVLRIASPSMRAGYSLSAARVFQPAETAPSLSEDGGGQFKIRLRCGLATGPPSHAGASPRHASTSAWL